MILPAVGRHETRTGEKPMELITVSHSDSSFKEEALTLIAVRYYTEQELGTITVDRDIAPSIEDQQIEAVQFAAKPFQSAVFPWLPQA